MSSILSPVSRVANLMMIISVFVVASKRLSSQQITMFISKYYTLAVQSDDSSQEECALFSPQGHLKKTCMFMCAHRLQ